MRFRSGRCRGRRMTYGPAIDSIRDHLISLEYYTYHFRAVTYISIEFNSDREHRGSMVFHFIHANDDHKSAYYIP